MSPTRRRAVRLAGVALAGSLAGCLSGAVDVTDSEDGETTGTESSPTTTDSGGTTHSGTVQATDQPTAYPVGTGTALPEGSVEFPAGPKSRPERPADLTAERVREYVLTFERRWVYNRLYRDDSTDVHQDCGVDSVTEYGEGYRVVAWCSAWANSGTGGTTIHADYFTQYATYFVGPDSTVRRDGKPKKRS